MPRSLRDEVREIIQGLNKPSDILMTYEYESDGSRKSVKGIIVTDEQRDSWAEILEKLLNATQS